MHKNLVKARYKSIILTDTNIFYKSLYKAVLDYFRDMYEKKIFYSHFDANFDLICKKN